MREFEEGQQVKLRVNFHIEDENEEPTGEIIPMGTIGIIDEWLDLDYYLVSYEPYGLFEMVGQILEGVIE